MAKRIEHDELAVTPLKLVVVFWQADFGFKVFVTCEEFVGKRIGDEAFASHRCPHIRPSIPCFSVVISQGKVESGGMAKLTEVVALSQILWFGQIWLHVLAGHKCVAEREMKVRLIGQSIPERAQVNISARVLVQMRIRLHSEDKRAAATSLCVKCELFAASRLLCGLIHELIKVPRVR